MLVKAACDQVSVLDQILAISNWLCLSVRQERDRHSLQSTHSIGPYCIHAPDLLLKVDRDINRKVVVFTGNQHVHFSCRCFETRWIRSHLDRWCSLTFCKFFVKVCITIPDSATVQRLIYLLSFIFCFAFCFCFFKSF